MLCILCVSNSLPTVKKAQEIFELKRKELTMHAGRDPGREGCPEEPWLKQCKLDEEALKQQEILYTQVRQLPTW